MDLGINPVVSNGSQSSSHLETDSGHFGGSGRRKLEEVKLEIIKDGGNHKHLKENIAVVDRSGSSAHSTSLPGISNGSDYPHFEGTAQEGFPLSPTQNLKSQPSSSSNLSESSDFFQVDPNKVNQSEKCTNVLANPYFGVKLELKDDDSSSSSINSTKSEKSSCSQGPTSASQVSDTTHESVMIGMSPTQSPPLQKMDRLGGYDPFRIPSSIFERSKSVTPMEWSVASNESLFSIHVGNNSFSRDHVFTLNDSGKFGESTKSDESNVSNSPPAIIPATETENKSIELDKDPETAGIADSICKDSDCLAAEDVSDRKVPPPVISWNSSNVSQHSDGSERSTDSFAFPIKKKRTCPSCYCSNCSRAFCYDLWPSCYFTWPSCYFTWPSCYCCNCSQAFCYCWNCSRKRLCCHSSNILANEVQSESSAGDAKKKHHGTVGPVLASNSTEKPWFPCCSALSSCSCCFCCTWSCCFPCGGCHFRRCCHFSRCCNLGSCCSFGSCCHLGSCYRFGSCCRFSSCCRFGSCCRFSSCCRFGSCCRCRPRCCHCGHCC